MLQDVVGNEQEIVSAIRHGLAERLGAEQFDVWFGPHVSLAVRDQRMVVGVDCQFRAERLTKQFRAELQRLASDLWGERGAVEILVEPALRGPAPSAAADQPPALVSSRDLQQTFDFLDEPAELPAPSVHVAQLGSADGVRPREQTLDSFVVGTGNCLAHRAAINVLQRPGIVSPLFVHGPPGTGKTHLLRAACAAARQLGCRWRVTYLSADQFTNGFLDALKGDGLPHFRRRCREVDLLAIDDVQFLAGKKATIVEFQHTIDALARNGRQLLLAADRSPGALAVLGHEIAARLAGGLVCPVDALDYPARVELARRHAQRMNHPLAEDVLNLVAAETAGDARLIHGALHRLIATSEALQRPVTVELAAEALRDWFQAAHRLVRLDDIERVICDVFGVDAQQLRNSGKSKSASQPRMLAMWLARKYTRAAFSEIGSFFGRRSHSTVISAERNVNRWVKRGEVLQLGNSTCHIAEAIRRAEQQLRIG